MLDLVGTTILLRAFYLLLTKTVNQIVAEVCYQYKVSCQYGCLLLLHVYTMKIMWHFVPKIKRKKRGTRKPNGWER